jgi:hypothetical protein
MVLEDLEDFKVKREILVRKDQTDLQDLGARTDQ